MSQPGPTVSGMESFYQSPQSSFVRQPVCLHLLFNALSYNCRSFSSQLNYHLYTPTSHLSTLNKSDNPQASFFMSDSLRLELTQRSEAIRAVPVTSSNLPDDLQGYHTLVLLDQPPPSSGPSSKDRRPNFGAWHSSVYKATSSTDGLTYVLRRIESMCLHHFGLSSVFVHS